MSKVTFRDPEWVRRVQGKHIPGTGNDLCKGPEVAMSLACAIFDMAAGEARVTPSFPT